MKKDLVRFEEKIKEYNESCNRMTIGTLNEKMLHSVVKNYCEDNTEFQEIELSDFVADVFDGEHVLEIQTQNFGNLNKKLSPFLEKYDVTVVYPCSHIKHIVWVDPQTGEVVKRNKSPKTGYGGDFLYEASRIRKFLGHPGLKFVVMLIDMDEYKLLNGYGKDRKIRANRKEMRPVALFDVVNIQNKYDLIKILPDNFPREPFKFKDFEIVMKMKGRKARFSLNALIEFGAVDILGKDKNSYIYKLII